MKNVEICRQVAWAAGPRSARSDPTMTNRLSVLMILTLNRLLGVGGGFHGRE